MRIGDLDGKNREKWGKMSRIKRNFSEKILSRHRYFEALAHWSAEAMVQGGDAFFQYANTPVARRLKTRIQLRLVLFWPEFREIKATPFSGLVEHFFGLRVDYMLRPALGIVFLF